jgi:hypothetical protein
MMTRRFRHAAALAALAVLATGCSRDNPVEPDEQVVGSYTLMAIGGQALPILVHQDAEITVQLVSGSLEMDADGTFVETLVFRETPVDGGDAEDSSNEISGTYSVAGRTVSFAGGEAGAWNGTASGGVITYVVGGATLLFER